jgi:hypothetical protein
LARLASLYETYEVNSLYFEVVLQGSLTASCGFIMAFDSDPGDDDPQQTLVGVQDMSQWEHNLSFSHLDGQQHRMHVRLRRPMLRGWYTSYNMAGDYRFSYCGQIYLYTTAAPTVAITWTLYAGYDISFFEPQIERIIPGAGGADVYQTFATARTTDANFMHTLDTVGAALATVRGVSYGTNAVVGPFRCLRFDGPGSWLLEFVAAVEASSSTAAYGLDVIRKLSDSGRGAGSVTALRREYAQAFTFGGATNIPFFSRAKITVPDATSTFVDVGFVNGATFTGYVLTIIWGLVSLLA